MATSDAPVLYAALKATASGLVVVPPRPDGSKAPVGEWKRYQTEPPGRAQIERWYANGQVGIGLVCGKVSGNLECLEFETEQIYQAFVDAAQAANLDLLIDRIEGGYLEASPRGGVHWLYRCTQIAGNTKLAREPAPDGTVNVLIETRGEGGYVIVAPSSGPTHPSGRPYLLLRGGFGSIPTISPAERAELQRLAAAFDRMPHPIRSAPASHPNPSTSAADGERPGDEYNRRTSWREILEPAGWKLVFQRGEEGYWCRPGKSRGISATTNYQGSGLLYVFSTSTVFDAEAGYSKFATYALIHHGGDHHTAARTLSNLGYGDRPLPPPAPSTPHPTPATSHPPPNDSLTASTPSS